MRSSRAGVLAVRSRGTARPAAAHPGAGRRRARAAASCAGSPAFSSTVDGRDRARSSAAWCRRGSACRSAPCRRASVPVARSRSTCSVPATLPERCATTSVVAAPPASTRAAAAGDRELRAVAAAPPPTRCRTPASGPMPIGGTSARSRDAGGLQVRRGTRGRRRRSCRWRSACSDGPALLVVGGQQDVADRRAVGVARLGGGDQPGPGALDQLARGRGRDLQRARHLVVAEPVELAHQQRRALLLGQVGEVLDQPPQLVAAAERRVDVLARAGAVAVGELGRGEAVAAQLVDAQVAHDAVQPRLELDRAVVVAQRPVRAQERLLHDPLGVAAVAAQRPAPRSACSRRR